MQDNFPFIFNLNILTLGKQVIQLLPSYRAKHKSYLIFKTIFGISDELRPFCNFCNLTFHFQLYSDHVFDRSSSTHIFLTHFPHLLS
jgi:hypothetical protein